MLSDLHNAVSLDISIQYMEKRSTLNSERNENIRLWNSDKTASFVNSFDPQNTKELLNMLSELKSKDNVSQQDIDNFVNYFNDFIWKNAAQVLESSCSKPHPNKVIKIKHLDGMVKKVKLQG